MTGYGATAPQTSIYGEEWVSITLPPGSLPTMFTLCTMTRQYSGHSRGRIINAYGANFFHGHDTSGAKPAAYYGNGMKWLTPQTGLVVDYNWLVMCTKSSGKAPNNVLADGKPIGVVDTAMTANWQLALNAGDANGLTTDWAMSHIIVWDQVTNVPLLYVRTLPAVSHMVFTTQTAQHMYTQKCINLYILTYTHLPYHPKCHAIYIHTYLCDHLYD
jgi:hypothetical protein